MIEPVSPSSPERILNEARHRVEGCLADLHALRTEGEAEYRAAISDLDQISPLAPWQIGESLASRLAAMERSSSLRQKAEDLDRAVTRLAETMGHIQAESDVLHGKVGLPGRQGDRIVTSLETVAIEAQEEERSRLAREIHDGPAQILANVALQLEYISKLSTREPARARAEMENIQKDLRIAVGEVRRFMYDLRPPALAQQGVEAALESHCQRLSQRFGMEIDVRWESSATLPPSHDTAVFRIVQEALQNVVKHAQATRVEVRARDVETFVEVVVQDNGKGFEPEVVRGLDPKHFGLAGMRARAQQIGATLDVASVPGDGTAVLLRVPLA